MEEDEQVQETLYIHRSVSLYKIPPRPAAGGHRSGDWLVGDRIFSGRLRMVARGEDVEVRMEEEDGELFAMCPVEYGKRAVAVEPVADSSRYFVLRVVDPSSGRHAFLGLGFDERGDAFDFTAALSDHERRIRRQRDAEAAAADGAAGSSSGGGGGGGELAALHTHRDLQLKEGETIRVGLKVSRPSSGGGGGFTARAAALPLGPLAPPPVGTVGGQAVASAAKPRTSTGNPFDDDGPEDK